MANAAFLHRLVHGPGPVPGLHHGAHRPDSPDGVWNIADLQAIAQAFPLLVIDLKVGEFSYADAGQMHLYLNYAREHWMKPGENPLVGLIMRAEKVAAEARYAMEGLPNKVLAAEYQTALPDEALPARELDKTRHELEARQHRRIAPD